MRLKRARVKKESFGGCTISWCAPPMTKPSMNVILTFDEALKLHLALGESLSHLNKYDRSKKKESSRGVDLCIKGTRIDIVEENATPRTPRTTATRPVAP
jgi:hypothetical protein